MDKPPISRTWLLIGVSISAWIHVSLVSAQEEYLYDTFDDGVIDTDLWGASGPVAERDGRIVLDTGATLTALREHLIAMSFSVVGYQDIVEGDHVNIHMATRAPGGDAVTVGEAIQIVPPANPGDPPQVYKDVFCCWYEDAIFDLEHCIFVPLFEAHWGVSCTFGLEYTEDGCVLVLVNGSVVYSFDVNGGDLAYTQGAEFWLKADSVEPYGGDVTATIDWAKAKGANQPSVASFTFSPAEPMVGGNIEFDASESEDPDGTIVRYEWDFGDGTSETSTQRTFHEYKSAATYTVRLTVRSSSGSTGQASKVLDLRLQEGDILLCREDVSVLPGSEWTHAGMYIGNDQVIEADWGGGFAWGSGGRVVVSPLSEWSFSGHNGRRQTYVRAIRVGGISYVIRSYAVDFALRQEHKTYDLASIVSHKKQSGENSQSWYCSELVWAAYLSATARAIDLDQPGNPQWGELVTPDEIAASQWIEKTVGEHKEAKPNTVVTWFKVFAGTAHCPVSLAVTAPDGLVLSKEQTQIPDAFYLEADVDEDGDSDDFFFILEPKPGEYLIHVIPEPSALPDEVYSLEITADGKRSVLAQDVPIRSIPNEPYIVTVEGGGAAPSTWYVDVKATGDNDGTSWTNALMHLQDALANARSGDTIWVAEGMYWPDLGGGQMTGDRTATFRLPTGVAIYGGFPTGGDDWTQRNPALCETILSGDIGTPELASDNSYHVVTASGTDRTTVLDGFTIADGLADADAPHDSGAGMYNLEGSPTVSHCTFVGNYARATGGGASNIKSEATFVNCAFSGNTADEFGGGMYNEANDVPLINCTFSANESYTLGGGVYSSTCTATLSNCILWANTHRQRERFGQSAQISGDLPPTVNHCCIQNWTGTLGGSGNTGANPLFADADGPDGVVGTLDDDLRLQAGSPCIDAGNNSVVPADLAIDLDGKARIASGTVDMGAYEWQETPPSGIVIGDFENDVTNWGPTWEDSVVLSFSANSTTVTSGNQSLKVQLRPGAYWALQWNAPEVPRLEAGTQLVFDVTMIQSEWTQNNWTQVAYRIAISSDGPGGWREYSPAARDRVTGRSTALDWGAWNPDARKTYSVDISNYDATGATWFQINISLQQNPDDGAGYFYIDNVQLLGL